MRHLVHGVARHAANRAAPAVLVALVLFLPAAAPRPNGIVSGARPVPYGFCIPFDVFQTLRRHHALAFRIDSPLQLKDVYMVAPIGSDDFPALLDFNRRLGVELPVDPEAPLPRNVDIWIPPEEIVASSCCIWIYSLWYGWVTARPVDRQSDIGFLDPTCSHAASNSGSVDIRLFPVPIAQQREWMQIVGDRPPCAGDYEVVRNLGPELRAMLQRVFRTHWDADHTFSFGKWVSETSKVARVIVSLPIADVDGDGDVRFALRLCEVFQQAGLPPGVVNVITGDGATGAALVRHPGLQKGRVHGQHRGRQGDPARGRGRQLRTDARARWQGGAPRVRRRGDRSGC